MSRASKAIALATIAALGAGLVGCGTGLTLYQPKLVAQDELLLRYDNHFEVYTAERTIAEGVRYKGLADFVRCVPDAHRHAEDAASDGSTGTAMSIAGGTFAVLGLGGLSGLAFYDDKSKTTTMGALLGAGIGLELVGLTLAIVGRSYRASANGHAVDAVNYYNDAVGSLGGSCTRPPPAGATVAAPPAPPSAPPPLVPRANDDDNADP